MARADEPRDELADVPPHGFVKARDALVARLRQEGDTTAAKAVSAMKRPPVTVWAVNRLAREAADTVEELIESADRMKQAQLGHGGATDLGAAAARHRAVLGKLARKAEEILSAASLRSSAELLRRIETTLTAAASDKDLRAALRNGRIDQELPPVGFEVFGGSMPAPRAAGTTGPPGRTSDRRLSVVQRESGESKTESQSEARGAAALEARREREAAAEDARRRRAELEAAIEKLRQEVHAATTKVGEADEQLRQSSAALRAARLAQKAARDALDAALKQARRRDV